MADIVENLFNKPVVTAPQLAQHFGVTYPTAKADINRLVRLGVLTKGPAGLRPQPFFAKPIIQAAFEEA